MPREFRGTIFRLVRRFYDGIFDLREKPANGKIAQMTVEYMLGQKEVKGIREYINRTNKFPSKAMN